MGRMTPFQKRGQSSLEFMLTYGWAMLAIAAVIGVIYSTGAINISSILPQSCNFYGQVECFDYGYDDIEGRVQLALINDLGADVKLTQISIYDANRDVTCGKNYPWNYESDEWKSSQTLTTDILCRALNGDSGSLNINRFEGFIEVEFYRDHPWCTTSGSVNPECLFTAIGRIKINLK